MFLSPEVVHYYLLPFVFEELVIVADGSITGFLMNELDFDSTVHICNSQKPDRMCHYK